MGDFILVIFVKYISFVIAKQLVSYIVGIFNLTEWKK